MSKTYLIYMAGFSNWDLRGVFNDYDKAKAFTDAMDLPTDSDRVYMETWQDNEIIAEEKVRPVYED